jgi:RNA polymerase sigma-70 factor (ECF subfamily)
MHEGGSDPDDDLSVIERVVAGDAESFRLLIQRHEQAVFGMVRNLVGDVAECEDVAQEVFLAAYRHLGRFDPARASFLTWLLTIARNKSFNALNARRKRPRPVEALPEAADRRTPEGAAVEEECFRLLDAALAALPFEQRTAFVLAEIQGLPLERIGAIEGVKLGTVKSRLSRAREKLRSLLRWTVEVEQPR